MNTPILTLLACLSLVSCQSPGSNDPAPGPLPAWTQSKATPSKSARQFKIETKLIEISNQKGASGIPNERYQKHLTPAERELYLRSISLRKGVDLMTSPSVIAGAGQPAKIEIIKEFLYPGPANEKAIRSEDLGVAQYFRVHPQSGDQPLKLDTVIQVSDFQGYEKLKTKEMAPIIKTRRFDESVQITSGQSILLGGLVTDQIPEGQKKTTLKTELIALVTVTEIDRNGRELPASKQRQSHR